MATQLFNAYQYFVDNNGLPLAGGFVYMYVPATTTPKDTWQDADETTLNANPIVLDANGRALIYGEGEYRQIVRDSLGNQIWDALTGVAEPTPEPVDQYLVLRSPTQPVDQGGLWRFQNYTNQTTPFQQLPANGILLIENTAPAGDFSSYFTAMSLLINNDLTTNIGHFPNPPGVPIGNDGEVILDINRYVQRSNNQLISSVLFAVTSVAGTTITGITFVGPNVYGYPTPATPILCWTDCNPLPSVDAVITIMTGTVPDGSGTYNLDVSSLTLVSGGLGYPASPSEIQTGCAGPPTRGYDVGPQYELFRDVVMNNGSVGGAIYFEALDLTGTARINAQIASFVFNADAVNWTGALVLSSGGDYNINSGVQVEEILSNGVYYPDPLGVTTARGLGYCDFFGYYINGVQIPDFRSSSDAGINVRALALSGHGSTYALLSLGNATSPQEGGLLMPGINNTSYAGSRTINLVSNNGMHIAEYQALVECRRLIYNAGNPIHLIGKTTSNFATAGVEINLNGAISGTATSNSPFNLNRLGTDGTITSYNKVGVNVGSVSVTGAATSYNTVSDRELKTDFEDFDAVAMLKAVPAQQAKFKAEPGLGARPVFVAQDFVDLLPHVVTQVDGVYMMDYSMVTPVLWRAMQQLEARLSKLEAR